MKYNIFLVIMMLIVSCVWSEIDTQYPEILDAMCDEWQQAGYDNNQSPIPDLSTLPTQTVSSASDLRLKIGQNDPNVLSVIVLSPGFYSFTSPLELPSNFILKGNHMYRSDRVDDNRTVLNFNLPTSTDNCILISNKNNVGIEDLVIKRTNGYCNGLENQQGHNICFDQSNNCWVIGVESRYPLKHHVDIHRSNNIEIEGCFLNDTRSQEDGGFGYGVLCEGGSHHCLIENNIFMRCRHAMIVQDNAHHNVYAYNYAYNSHQSSDFIYEYTIPYDLPDSYTADICCHGQPAREDNPSSPWEGPFENLFEGNVCSFICVDSSHDKNGSYNTFFRNVAKDYGGRIDGKNHPRSIMSHAYGLKNQPRQNFLCNYLICTKWKWCRLGLGRAFWGDSPFEKETKVKRVDFWGSVYHKKFHPAAEASMDASYYTESRPAFFPSNETAYPFPLPSHIYDWTPARARGQNCKKCWSRNDPSGYVQTYYIIEDMVYPEDFLNHSTLRDLLYSDGIRVLEDRALIIDATSQPGGISVSFPPGYGLKVRGSLFVYGGPDRIVTLKSTLDNPIGDDQWDGIKFGKENEGEGYYVSEDWDFGDSQLNYCRIRDARRALPSSTHYGGGGVSIINTDTQIDGYTLIEFNHCIIEDCSSRNVSGYLIKGGGAYIKDGTLWVEGHSVDTIVDVKFNDCTFESNSAYYGGAVYAERLYPEFRNCTFINNDAFGDSYQNGSHGGAICIEGSDEYHDLIISNCIFSGNRAYLGTGAGIYYRQESAINDAAKNDVVFVNNTFFHNGQLSIPSRDRGSAINCKIYQSDVFFVNNVIYGNHIEPTGIFRQLEIFLSDGHENESHFAFYNNCIEYLTETNGTIQDMTTNGLFVIGDPNFFDYVAANNIGNNPLFCNSYQIDFNSPCFNTGLHPNDFLDDIGISYTAPATDALGNPRIAGSNIDIGAIEAYVPSPYAMRTTISVGRRIRIALISSRFI